MPHTPLGVLNITLVTGNEVNMDMEDTLSSRRPNIHADVVAVRLELLVQQPALFSYKCHASVDLFGCQVEKAGDMATRDDQRMPRADRVAITRAVRKFVT